LQAEDGYDSAGVPGAAPHRGATLCVSDFSADGFSEPQVAL
jgi:hypothetical protein